MIKFQIIIEKKGIQKTIKPFLSRTTSTLALIFSVIVLSTLIGLGIHLVLAQTNPTQPPPQGNVPGPINVSDVAQTKLGDLSVKEAAQNSFAWQLEENGDGKVQNLVGNKIIIAPELVSTSLILANGKIKAPNQGWEAYTGVGGSSSGSSSQIACPNGRFLSYVKVDVYDGGDRIHIYGNCHAPFEKDIVFPSGGGGEEQTSGAFYHETLYWDVDDLTTLYIIDLLNGFVWTENDLFW